MKLSKDAQSLQDAIGYRFQKPDLLITALTHASMAGERRHNERLEFLGDRVLGLVMAEALFEEDSDASEGQLAPRYNALVRKETCADVARQIGLGAAMKLGRSEMLSGGRKKDALLGDAMEAVIAATYRDGGFNAAKDMILRLWGQRIAQVEDDARDAKTMLQEWAQARKGPPPNYETVDRQGPDHAPEFTIKVTLHTGQSAQAKAASKRTAEQAAAKELLKKVTQ
ncbi:MAG: ribonuclease III [Pseudomonadota bacterium]